VQPFEDFSGDTAYKVVRVIDGDTVLQRREVQEPSTIRGIRMGLLEREYSAVRNSMKLGDVIAFSGKKAFSEAIKLATRSNMSHVGVVLQTKLKMNGESHGRLFNQVAEATASIDWCCWH